MKKNLKEKNNIKKKKRKKKKSTKNEYQNIDNYKQKNNSEIKFISKVENKEKNNFCFYSPYKISTPKTAKNIIFPNSDTKSNKS